VLARVFITALPAFNLDWVAILLAISIVTMTVGNLIALRQRNIKRMLAYSSIAQAGYIVIGLVANAGAGAGGGVRAVLLYLFAYLFTNLGAFIAVIAWSRQTGSDDIETYAGLIRRQPVIAAALVVFFLSLAGIPPTAGFVGKFFVFGAAIQAGQLTLSHQYYYLAIVGVVNSVISVGYYFNVVRYMFFTPPTEEGAARLPGALSASLAVATVMVLFIGLFPQPFIDWASRSVQMIL